MKLRLRYIYGILILLGTDLLFLIEIISTKKLSSNYIFLIVLLALFIGYFLDKKFGYLIDKHRNVFIILGAIVFSITILIMTYMVVNK